VTSQGQESAYWNIPIANTTSLLLGTGTSITQAAMRELAKAGVLVGFCGGGGTPLFSATDYEIPIVWFSPQSEYRPTEYLQAWVKFWFDDALRLLGAKKIQQKRLDMLLKVWTSARTRIGTHFQASEAVILQTVEKARLAVEAANSIEDLLTQEARLTKFLYKTAANAVRYGDFSRKKHGEGSDPANGLLDHGNYLTYGLGATATWVLGLPHGLALLHGKTRRGGLVFDVADLVKDAIILPQAFVSAMEGQTQREFREQCIEKLLSLEALDYMIDTLKDIAQTLGKS
jgi:CRISP-associated protein Cas1